MGGAMTCCYTGNRLPDTNFVGNAEMCALDMTYARQSNHGNRAAFTYYDSASANEAYCTGFAYEEGSSGEAVKYNTLFHMAMMTNLYDDGYVKNIPGAPLCGCVEQMPIVSHAKCTKAIRDTQLILPLVTLASISVGKTVGLIWLHIMIRLL